MPPTSAPLPSNGPRPNGDKPEHEILFQQFFKSANPQRTYAAQLKRASNGNHYLVLTEGKRDPAGGDVRKTRLFVYSEDFIDFFKLLQSAAHFIKANPVPDEVKSKRQRFWAKHAREEKAANGKTSPNNNAPAPRAGRPASQASKPAGTWRPQPRSGART